MYGSARFARHSQNARMRSNEPSRADAGVVFPRFESVPIVIESLDATDAVVSPVSKLVSETADALGFNPPTYPPVNVVVAAAGVVLVSSFVPSPPSSSPSPSEEEEDAPNVLEMPSGNNIRCISAMTPHSFSTNRIPRRLAATATSAAAPARSRVVLAACGLDLSTRGCSPPIANRHRSLIFKRLASASPPSASPSPLSNFNNSSIFSGLVNVDGLRRGATEPRRPAPPPFPPPPPFFVGTSFFLLALPPPPPPPIFDLGTATLCFVLAVILAILDEWWRDEFLFLFFSSVSFFFGHSGCDLFYILSN
mmetsp:Transcript_18334/g.44267  ORF Transcript_18334/g.44267 Transcript_18334/m.44267 type:complete len:308 (-) Transcript_18334:186-1109(-)